MQGLHDINRDGSAVKMPALFPMRLPDRALFLRFYAAFLEQAELQKAQIFLWCPVFTGIGILLYFDLPTEPTLSFAFGALAISIASLVFLWDYVHAGRSIGILLFCAVLGFAAATLHTATSYTPVLAKKIAPVNVTGTIIGLEHLEDGQGLRAILKDLNIEKLTPAETPRKIRLKLRRGDDLAIGQRVSMLAGLNPPASPSMPGGFDFQRYMFFQGIGGIGFVYGKATILQPAALSTFPTIVQNWRYEIGRNIEAAMSPRLAAVANALMTGPRAAILESDYEAIRDSGLAHMLAISGLHIGLFFGAIFFMTRLLLAAIPPVALRYPIKKYAAALAMAGAIFYTFISGGTIPTQRAILMMGLVFLALILDRSPLSLRMIAFAAICILLSAPDSLVSASFQMSFSAVAALIVFYGETRPYWSKFLSRAGWLRRLGFYVAGVAMTSVVATFATAPFTLFHFQQIPLYSVLANVLAVPVLGFIVMPLAIIAFILMPLGLEQWPLWGVGWGVDLILQIAHSVAEIKHATFVVPQWPMAALLWFSCAFILAILLKGRMRLLCLLPLIGVAFAISTVKHPDILIGASVDLVGVKTKDGGLMFSNTRKDAFTRENWMQTYGLDPEAKPQKWPREGRVEDFICGAEGCRLERGGYKISFLRSPAIFPEECQWADVIIADQPLPKCASGHPVIIDRYDIYDRGAYSIALDPSLDIRDSRTLRGERPWVAEFQKDEHWRASQKGQ